MKTTISTLLAIVLASVVWAEEPKKDMEMQSPETMLNAAAHYLDTILADAQDSLELIAATPEAKRGDWTGIKPHLKKLDPSLPGVYFFVLPNGDYYTITKDFTNLNLSDRPYFKTLFSGEPIKGFSMYSRSSGKKTALVAVPITTDGKVSGAIGISIFLNELDARMNQALVLPPNYIWYVLNPEGSTILHKASDFIFMNALKQAGDSLRKAASKAMKNKKGTMEYEFGSGTRHAYYQKLADTDWWMFLAEIEKDGIPVPPQLKLSLEHFVPDLQRNLGQIDESLAKSIETMKIDIGSESDIRKLLDAVLDDNLCVFEAAYIDPKGYLRYIEPGDYKNFENTDINDQEHIIAMQNEPAPQFTSGFPAVEGFQAVVIARPLFDNEKQFAGSVNVVIRPELLVDGLLKKTTIPDDYELWIMQLDGMIIYDQDKEEIGKMLFTDPSYADYGNLLELGKEIVASPAGEGSYIYLSPETQKQVVKNAIWQTVKLNGREWRVVLAYRPYE